MPKSSRRVFLKNSAAVAAALSLRKARAFATSEAAIRFSLRLQQFSYGDVELLDGPMLEQFRHTHRLFLDLSDDGLLKPFRQLTAMPAPGEDMGGWYSPSDKFNPPKDMTGYVPGHSFGQYLSGLARAYAVTGDRATQEKVQRLVRGFAPTVSPKFYADYTLPAYTFDKVNCGLIDAHRFAADPIALAVLEKSTAAVLPSLPEKALTPEEMDARPHRSIANTWDEQYTLPENFYLAYQRGAGARYRQLARRFLQDDAYFAPLAEGQNILPGKHAYSHVNGLCSAMQAYWTDGSEMHFRAARNGFQFVREQSFATGGWGPDESFRNPGSDELAKTLDSSHHSFETPCGAYAHFKIARYLMRTTGESTYGDSMEAVLHNTILGARLIRPDGVSFYYSDYNNDATKVDYEQKWPCCSGTFPQLTADYGISSYFRSADSIYVNLYVPSRVRWKQGAARVSITQETNYPSSGEVRMHVQLDRPERFTVALRIPEWAGKRTQLTVSGKRADADLRPGSWSKLNRMWNDGDRVELSLDMPVRLVPIDPQHPEIVALMHGPVALFAIDPGQRRMTGEALLAAQRVSSSSSDWAVETDQNEVLMRPFAAISTERYRLYQRL